MMNLEPLLAFAVGSQKGHRAFLKGMDFFSPLNLHRCPFFSHPSISLSLSLFLLFEKLLMASWVNVCMGITCDNKESFGCRQFSSNPKLVAFQTSSFCVKKREKKELA
ncbi:hypothetical protein E2320_009314 [Naja naja]|nr:hypothetical protein E2320_009314 [Naja naja]